MSITQEQKDGLLANLISILNTQEGPKMVANHIIDGDVTSEELENTGMYQPQYRAEVENILAELKKTKEEELVWTNATSQNTIDGYKSYINQYPSGKYITMAQTLIAGIKAPNAASEKGKYINELKININAYNTMQLDALGINFNDLRDNGIEIPEAINKIWDNKGITLEYGDTPNSIPKGRTEIYFWGTPGSGKTCTLSAILSTAQKKGYYQPQEGTGLMYMNQLSNMFFNDVATLPPPSPVDVTQALSFDLRDDKQVPHPVSMIEISGEIFECFSYAVNGQTIPDDGHKQAYESLLKFLKSTDNPKYHFFIIDVNNKTLDSFGQSQMTYLQNAALFFNNKQIFNNKTAGINILVTKSDLLSSNKAERRDEAIRILKEDYLNFVNSLRGIAIKYNLMKKNDLLKVIPFTLGDVYLKDKCIFDSTMSEDVIRILQENVAKKAEKGGILNFFNL